jgi:hypothetical protein
MVELPPSSRQPHSGSRTPETGSISQQLPEGEDTIRNLKASESVVAAFQAAGIPSPPGDLAAIIGSYVKNATREIPGNQIANMSPGSGLLGASAATGVNLFVGNMTPTQREAMRAGVNPLDPAAVFRYSAMLNNTLGAGALAGLSRGEGAGRGTPNSGTYGREFGSAMLSGSYNALLGEGYTKGQLNAVMPYAQQLGWHDRQGLRDLADAGKPFAADAAAYQRAVQQGNTQEAERIKKKMQKQHDEATPGSKEHRGRGNIMRRLHIDTKAEHEAGRTPAQATPQAAAAQASAEDAERKKSASTKAADWDDIEGAAAPASTPKADQQKAAKAEDSPGPANPVKPVANGATATSTKAASPKIG